jgi:hypothetical protein
LPVSWWPAAKCYLLRGSRIGQTGPGALWNCNNYAFPAPFRQPGGEFAPPGFCVYGEVVTIIVA